MRQVDRTIKKDSSNVVALRNFFVKEGQGAASFVKEFKELSAKEQQELGDAVRAQEGV